MADVWKVIRHGGKLSSKWIEIYVGDSEQKASEVYEKNLRLLRQGGIKLLRNEETESCLERPRPRFVFSSKSS